MQHPFTLLRLWHVFLDILLLWVGFLMGYFVRVGFLFSSDVPFGPFAGFALGGSMAWSAVLVAGGYYKLQKNKTGLLRMALRVVGGLGGVAGLMAGHFFFRQMIFSRLMSLYGLVFGIFLLLASFYGFELFAKSRKKAEKGLSKTIIVGGGRIAEETIEQIKNDPYAAINLVGVIDPSGIYKQIKGATVLGKLNKLEPVLDQHRISNILQVNNLEQAENIAHIAQNRGIAYKYLSLFNATRQESPTQTRIGDLSFSVLSTKGKNKLTWVSRVLE